MVIIPHNISYAELLLTIQGDSNISPTLNTSLENTPKTITIIDQNTPNILSSNRLEDFADYIPDVQIGREEAGIASDVFIRGFSTGGRLYKDGLVDNQNLYLCDPSTVESIEIIKGHDSVLFGSGSPRGTVNYINKKPLYQPYQTLRTSIGNPDQLRLEWDSTGVLT